MQVVTQAPREQIAPSIVSVSASEWGSALELLLSFEQWVHRPAEFGAQGGPNLLPGVSRSARTFLTNKLDEIGRAGGSISYEFVSAEGVRYPLSEMPGRSCILGKALEMAFRHFETGHFRMVQTGLTSAFNSEDRIRGYLRSASNEYLNLIAQLANDIGELPPGCGTSVCIPVAAHEEGDHIYRTLETFLNQTERPGNYEIVLLLNHPHQTKAGRSITPDKSIEEVERFQRDHPEINVKYLYCVFDREHVAIGYIRKILADAVLVRQLRRQDFKRDHIIVNVDADTVGLNPKFLENYRRQFEKRPNVDAFSGKIEFDWPTLLSDPVLFFGSRLVTALDAYTSAIDGPGGFGGANFAIRASSYAAVGGFGHEIRGGEDVNLARRLCAGRAGDEEHIAIASGGARSRLYSSARRGLAVFEVGYAPALQWSTEETAFDVENSTIRSRQPASIGLDRYFEALDSAHFVTRLETTIQQTIDLYVIDQSAGSESGSVDSLNAEAAFSREEIVDAVLRRAFGLECEIDTHGRIHINDVSRVREYLRNFGQEAPAYWRDKLGFPLEREASRTEIDSNVSLPAGFRKPDVQNPISADLFDLSISIIRRVEAKKAVRVDGSI